MLHALRDCYGCMCWFELIPIIQNLYYTHTRPFTFFIYECTVYSHLIDLGKWITIETYKFLFTHYNAIQWKQWKNNVIEIDYIIYFTDNFYV